MARVGAEAAAAARDLMAIPFRGRIFHLVNLQNLHIPRTEEEVEQRKTIFQCRGENEIEKTLV